MGLSDKRRKTRAELQHNTNSPTDSSAQLSSAEPGLWLDLEKTRRPSNPIKKWDIFVKLAFLFRHAHVVEPR